MIEAAGRAHDLPLEFFARVIWQESRFRPDTVGPRRRNGASAQGIAQFMPSTAAERGLLDPFDPVQALPKAAQFLRELNDQFGNLGLAAAAYNAGPTRVRGWLSGARTLSVETRKYVAAVTGVSVDEWAKGGARKPPLKASPNCRELIALQQPASPQGPRPPPHEEPVQSQTARLARNDPVALGSVAEDLLTPRHEGLPSRGAIVEQPASPQGPPPPSHEEPVQSQTARLVGNDSVALGSVAEDLVTPRHEGLPSRGARAEQPASPQRPPPPSHEEPVQSQTARLAKNESVPLDSVRGDLLTARHEGPPSRGDTNLFIEKLTERVKLTADSPWGVQLSAGFSRERVLAAYATIANRYATILVGRDASILSSVFRSRGTGTFYQIRVGTDTFERANNLCVDIQRAGGACMVLRNGA
jgi:hypothetical protein